MDFAILDWIVDQTGVAMFAAFALYINWHQHRDGLRREASNSDIHRTDKMEILDVLQEVARSNAELCQLIRELRKEMNDEK
jgi:hypothetical protein